MGKKGSKMAAKTAAKTAPTEIYWYPGSPFAKPVMLFCKVTNLKFTEHMINLAKGEYKDIYFNSNMSWI